MSSERSYLNAVLRDPDTMSVMAAPGPPGPLMTDKHDGTVNDVPVALVSTNSTAHILEQINPSINPYDLSNDALVKNLVNYIDFDHHFIVGISTPARPPAEAALRTQGVQPVQARGRRPAPERDQ
jgi:hypothetical protein